MSWDSAVVSERKWGVSEHPTQSSWNLQESIQAGHCQKWSDVPKVP